MKVLTMKKLAVISVLAMIAAGSTMASNVFPQMMSLYVQDNVDGFVTWGVPSNFASSTCPNPLTNNNSCRMDFNGNGESNTTFTSGKDGSWCNVSYYAGKVTVNYGGARTMTCTATAEGVNASVTLSSN